MDIAARHTYIRTNLPYSANFRGQPCGCLEMGVADHVLLDEVNGTIISQAGIARSMAMNRSASIGSTRKVPRRVLSNEMSFMSTGAGSVMYEAGDLEV
ncbi:uncharacterized protein CLUP02_07983 [Colletotrichum lupini]|uniref:Uncharacterized protein n=1 Tax=Colletotrichum lupini TaxID=145971 RepID=A0A9Q8SSY0_9PEZI|nr:uncharacterized protein CLUP02_07983 [Colletotrichum lupini]UQC82495.1 hypothetical protein CLUP02_07983 [Colletotrichum lupini]